MVRTGNRKEALPFSGQEIAKYFWEKIVYFINEYFLEMDQILILWFF